MRASISRAGALIQEVQSFSINNVGPCHSCEVGWDSIFPLPLSMRLYCPLSVGGFGCLVCWLTEKCKITWMNMVGGCGMRYGGNFWCGSGWRGISKYFNFRGQLGLGGGFLGEVHFKCTLKKEGFLQGLVEIRKCRIYCNYYIYEKNGLLCLQMELL